MNIFYYVTSHGYGHGVRTCCLADALPSQCHITFRTTLPETFFREELTRQFNYIPGEFDCGCIQSDGVTTDVASTLSRYAMLAERNSRMLDNEIHLCKTHNVDLIISDITPFAFEIAHACSLPSIAITNFTWYDIYQEYLDEMPTYAPMLDTIRKQYELADSLLALSPALTMDYFKNRIPVNVVGRKGIDVRKKILSRFNIDKDKKIGLIYVGNFGMHTAQWKDLEKFTDWEFLGVYPLQGNPRNFHIITKEHFRYQDLIASTDAMFSKLGYGAVSECMLNGKPIVYLPRTKFAEYPMLEQAVITWGGGIKMSTVDFYSLNWAAAIDKIEHARLQPVISNGIEKAVEVIVHH
ncbi:MAG: hypothetical protein ACM31E_02380 [Fibrobacterota bacterium]